MASIGDIARDRTDLGEAAIAHLQALASEWTLLADLGFADLVLWLPTWNDGGFVAAAQVRPTTGPTRMPEDIVGQFSARGRIAILDRAAASRLPVTDRRDDRPRVPRGDEAFPVMHAGKLVGVIQRHSSVEARADGALERMYLDAFSVYERVIREAQIKPE